MPYFLLIIVFCNKYIPPCVLRAYNVSNSFDSYTTLLICTRRNIMFSYIHQQETYGLLVSLSDKPSWYSLVTVAVDVLTELVAKLAISLNQLPRFNLSGRTGSGFQMTCAGGSWSFLKSSFFIMTHTGRFMFSGLGVLCGKLGGQKLQVGLVTFLMRFGQSSPGEYRWLLL